MTYSSILSFVLSVSSLSLCHHSLFQFKYALARQNCTIVFPKHLQLGFILSLSRCGSDKSLWSSWPESLENNGAFLPPPLFKWSTAITQHSVAWSDICAVKPPAGHTTYFRKEAMPESLSQRTDQRRIIFRRIYNYSC